VRVYIEGIGLCGPGLNGWIASRPVLSGLTPYVPAPTTVPPSSLLPANERRRAVQTVKLVLAVGAEAFAGARRGVADVATVFASSSGDGDTIHDILTVLASSDREISPIRFHNSVHNAPAGYWSIANRSHAPSSSIGCHDESFAAGLLEAAVQATVDQQAVALFTYDTRAPEPLNTARPIGANFAAALIVTPHPSETTFARFDIELQHRSAATTMKAPALEELRRGTPAARCLPLLAALTQDMPETVMLEFVSGLTLALAIEPLLPGPAVRDDQPGAATVRAC
jgi:hypothetical protein